MSLSGIILGLINIAIFVAILLLVGAVVLWFCQWLKFPVPDMVQKLYLAVVALIALYMLVALLLGLPGVHLIRFGGGALWPMKLPGNSRLLPLSA